MEFEGSCPQDAVGLVVLKARHMDHTFCVPTKDNKATLVKKFKRRSVAPPKKSSARHRLAIYFSLLRELDSVRWESPPSNLLKATRKPDGLVLSEIAGKGLVVVREGITNPNAPYLR
ncbi:hypothetical protein NC651_027912 [Populus alba x Populus x berolinensis]|nr:hypothetical protein NC651_027912 [Populus alba x Populus x berolinensis]